MKSKIPRIYFFNFPNEPKGLNHQGRGSFSFKSSCRQFKSDSNVEFFQKLKTWALHYKCKQFSLYNRPLFEVLSSDLSQGFRSVKTDFVEALSVDYFKCVTIDSSKLQMQTSFRSIFDDPLDVLFTNLPPFITEIEGISHLYIPCRLQLSNKKDLDSDSLLQTVVTDLNRSLVDLFRVFAFKEDCFRFYANWSFEIRLSAQKSTSNDEKNLQIKINPDRLIDDFSHCIKEILKNLKLDVECFKRTDDPCTITVKVDQIDLENHSCFFAFIQDLLLWLENCFLLELGFSIQGHSQMSQLSLGIKNNQGHSIFSYPEENETRLVFLSLMSSLFRSLQWQGSAIKTFGINPIHLDILDQDLDFCFSISYASELRKTFIHYFQHFDSDQNFRKFFSYDSKKAFCLIDKSSIEFSGMSTDSNISLFCLSFFLAFRDSINLLHDEWNDFSFRCKNRATQTQFLSFLEKYITTGSALRLSFTAEGYNQRIFDVIKNMSSRFKLATNTIPDLLLEMYRLNFMDSMVWALEHSIQSRLQVLKTLINQQKSQDKIGDESFDVKLKALQDRIEDCKDFGSEAKLVVYLDLIAEDLFELTSLLKGVKLN